MKSILFFIASMGFFFAEAQDKKPFNCAILKEIVQRINEEKQNIALNKLIIGKYYFAVNSETGESRAGVWSEYKNDKVLDSIMKLPNFNQISDSRNDSLFYLKDNNLIVDTFLFFTPECSCNIDGKNITVVNSYDAIPQLHNYNIMSVFIIANDKGYSTVSLKHSSAKEDWDCVVFRYLIEQNKPVMKKVEVVLQNDY